MSHEAYELQDFCFVCKRHIEAAGNVLTLQWIPTLQAIFLQVHDLISLIHMYSSCNERYVSFIKVLSLEEIRKLTRFFLGKQKEADSRAKTSAKNEAFLQLFVVHNDVQFTKPVSEINERIF